METTPQGPPASARIFHPMAGWEAASRWNASALDWMARGFQQWVALMTTVPPHFLASLEITPDEPVSSAGTPLAPVVPVQAAPRRRRDGEARAMAKAEPKRPSRAKPAKNKTKKTRARG